MQRKSGADNNSPKKSRSESNNECGQRWNEICEMFIYLFEYELYSSLTFRTVTSHCRTSRTFELCPKFGFFHNGDSRWIGRIPLNVPCHFKCPKIGSLSEYVHNNFNVSDWEGRTSVGQIVVVEIHVKEKSFKCIRWIKFFDSAEIFGHVPSQQKSVRLHFPSRNYVVSMFSLSSIERTNQPRF